MIAIEEMVVRTRQSHDQPIEAFLSDLKATARMCHYKVKCEDEMCGKLVDFTKQMVLEQLTMGLADKDTQRKLLKNPEVMLAEAEELVVAEEIGKLSQVDSRSVSGISQYKRDQRDNATREYKRDQGDNNRRDQRDTAIVGLKCNGVWKRPMGKMQIT